MEDIIFFTARKQSLRRLCFHRCLYVHGGLPHCMLRYTPILWADTPLGQTPLLGRHPPGQTPCGQTLSGQCMLGYGQQVVGTHPTGMQSRSVFLV